MKKVVCLVLILALNPAASGNTAKYIIMLTDDTRVSCSILENDPPSKRLKVQPENSTKTDWVSYYSIRAIIEATSQKDVTHEFIQPSVDKIESRTMIGVDPSIYTYLAISVVVSIVFYIIIFNSTRD